MAENLQKVYAQAMYELCQENNCCSQVFEELQDSSDIFDENEDFVSLLSSPLINDEEKKSIIDNVFKGRVSDIVLDFFSVVVLKGRAKYLSEVCQGFKNLYYDEHNILDVTIITAQPFSDILKKKLVEKLENTLNKKIIMHEKIDSSLLGGIIVRYNNSEIDSSVKGRLDKLKSQIDSIIA